jgi:SAM-dependent methyltransferase
LADQVPRTRRWEYYDLAFGPVRAERADLYEELFRQAADGVVSDVLELGCGTGRWLIALGGRGYGMTGVDIDADALSLAGQKCRAAGVAASFVRQDLASWRPAGSYDAVIAPNNALKWLPSGEAIRSCLAQVALAVRAGGVAILDLSFEPADWRTADWPGEEDLAAHAFVSSFTGPGLTGEYRCFYGTPDLAEGTIPLVERFVCRDGGREVVLEERSPWLMFSAGQFCDWVGASGLLSAPRFYERRTAAPSEIALSDLDANGGQCLAVIRRKPEKSC